MADTEIFVLAILASAFALYGFPMAYYMFGRGLQDQERARLWQSHREWREPKTAEELYPGLRKLGWRGVALNILLVGSTVLFIVSVVGDLAYLGNSQPLYLQIGAGGFFSLAIGVVAWFLVVGGLNARETLLNMPPKKARGV